jgi:PPOX class probable F420-dependent enzyme
MDTIPESFQDLLQDKKRAFAFLATLMPNGSPQVTPVWFSSDGTHILVNTAAGRVKDRNMRNRAAVAICIADPGNPYRYLQIQGRVDSFTAEGADEHIDSLSAKYTGNPKYQNRRPGEKRILYRILPLNVDPHG